jgi:hypothetical protein
MTKINIFQIFHDEKTKSESDSEFVLLERLENPRVDWGDYWAIRNFFASNTINDGELYGFLAPDFLEKTGLSATQVHQFIRDNPGHDAYTFSPCIEDSACYLNVFEQGNLRHSDLVAASQDFLKEVQLEVDLQSLVMDFRSTVYGNYVVAKRSFWETWFPLTEKIFEICENKDSDLGRRLNSLATDGTSVCIKVLLIERIASLILALLDKTKVCAFDIALMPCLNQRYQPYAPQMSLLNQFKADYRQAPDQALLRDFYAARGAILQACEGERLACAKEGFLTAQRLNPLDLLYVCFTHVPLPFDFPSYVTPIYLGAAQGPGKNNLRDLAPEWEPYHPQLGAVAGSFALKNYIVKHRLQLRSVGICQYRKFVSNKNIGGIPAPNYRAMNVVDQKILGATDLAESMGLGNRTFLVGKLDRLVGYFEQYKDAHHVEDFLHFTAAAVELGVLHSSEVMRFFQTELFLPGGIEMGIFPADMWVAAMGAIEAVVRVCVTRYPALREGYQIRSWAFCAERLGSYIFLKYLNSATLPADWADSHFGQLNLYTGDENGMYRVGT